MKLNEGTKTYLIELTTSFERSPHEPIIVERIPQSILSCKNQLPQPNALNYLIPNIILWDPLEQFPDIFSKNNFCNHSSHLNPVPLLPKRWKCGQSERESPRKLYGNDGIVLLVSRVYKCCDGHEVLAHDPFIIDRIPQQDVPFFTFT